MLAVKGVTKRYKKTTVLNNTGFTLAPGEMLGIAGHNGSGKSTLLSIVAQVIPADRGEILENDVPVLSNRAFMRQAIGYIPQRNGLLSDLTVTETLRFWQRVYGISEPIFAKGSASCLLGLEELAKKKVGALSGGMQKRLSAALAMMHQPRYLLMDEVLPSLDRHYRLVFLDWMVDFRKQGGAVLYCSHEVEELNSLCDSILVLRDGETVYYGDARTFPTEPAILDRMMNPVSVNKQSNK